MGEPPHDRALPRGRPLVGYALVAAASLIAGVNATLGKIAMESGGLSPNRVSELRATGSAIVLLGWVAFASRRNAVFARRELPFFAFFGVFGLALAQFLYYSSLERLEIGVALLIVNFAIVLIALWARFFGKELVQRRLWVAIALTFVGLSFLVQAWSGLAVDGVGVGAALSASVLYAVFILMAERGVRNGRPATFVVAWGFFFAALFWAAVQPWWTFPYDLLENDVSLLGRLAEWSAPVWLLVVVIIPFTVATFALPTAALRYLPATRVVLVAVLEPVFGALVAFAWLEEELAAGQIAGGLLVLAGVLLGQSARRSGPRAEVEASAELIPESATAR